MGSIIVLLGAQNRSQTDWDNSLEIKHTNAVNEVSTGSHNVAPNVANG
jgi:hypothetical protein